MSPDTPSGASGQGDAPTGGQRPPSKTADVISPAERPKLSSPSAGQGDAPTGGQRPPSKTADVTSPAERPKLSSPSAGQTADVTSPAERPKLSSPSAGQTANTVMSMGQRDTSSGVSGQGDAPTGGQRPLGQTADVNWATSLRHPNLTPNRHALLMREERREIEKDPILSRTAKQSMLHDLELSEEAYHLSHTQTADSASRTERPVLPSASDKQATETDTSAGQPNVFSDVGRQSDIPFASQRVSEPSADVTSRAERPDLAGTAAGQVANAPTSLKQPNALSGVVKQGDTPPTNRRDAVRTPDAEYGPTRPEHTFEDKPIESEGLGPLPYIMGGVEGAGEGLVGIVHEVFNEYVAEGIIDLIHPEKVNLLEDINRHFREQEWSERKNPTGQPDVNPHAEKDSATTTNMGQPDTSSGESGQKDTPTGGQSSHEQATHVKRPAERPDLLSTSTGQFTDRTSSTQQFDVSTARSELVQLGNSSHSADQIGTQVATTPEAINAQASLARPEGINESTLSQDKQPVAQGTDVANDTQQSDSSGTRLDLVQSESLSSPTDQAGTLVTLTPEAINAQVSLAGLDGEKPNTAPQFNPPFPKLGFQTDLLLNLDQLTRKPPNLILPDSFQSPNAPDYLSFSNIPNLSPWSKPNSERFPILINVPYLEFGLEETKENSRQLRLFDRLPIPVPVQVQVQVQDWAETPRFFIGLDTQGKQRNSAVLITGDTGSVKFGIGTIYYHTQAHDRLADLETGHAEIAIIQTARVLIYGLEDALSGKDQSIITGLFGANIKTPRSIINIRDYFLRELNFLLRTTTGIIHGTPTEIINGDVVRVSFGKYSEAMGEDIVVETKFKNHKSDELTFGFVYNSGKAQYLIQSKAFHGFLGLAPLLHERKINEVFLYVKIKNVDFDSYLLQRARSLYRSISSL